MAAWNPFRRRRRVPPYEAVSEEERMARYLYLLNTLPASVIEKAHADAFGRLPREKRREMFDELRPFMSEAEQAQPAEPRLLARVMRRADAQRSANGADEGGAPTTIVEEREGGREREGERRMAEDGARPAPWLLNDPVLTSLVAYHFLSTQVLVAYFTVGAGSMMIGDAPGWVGDYGSGAGGVDGGGFGGGFDGGGGGFGGGFDGGGFGGGFDGGGGGFGG